MPATQSDSDATGHQQIQSQMFAYSQKDIENILVTDSLFSQPGEANHTEMGSELFNLTTRRTKTYLHIVTLSDYVRQGVIPRGLRWQKEPMLGNKTADFCDRWCAILNKCSFDLMTLLIDNLKQDLAVIDATITAKITSLNDSIQNETERNDILKNNEEQMKKLSNDIKEIKIKKFNRDKKDLSEGNVYYWRNPERRTRPRSLRKVRPRGDLHSTLDNSSDMSTTSSSSFLISRPHVTAQQQRGRGRGRGRPPKAARDAGSRGNLEETRWTRARAQSTRE